MDGDNMSIDFGEADDIAVKALDHARSLPPGPARTDALKEAGKLRAAADRLREFPECTTGRPSKYSRSGYET
jgi:hypothetical protein